MSSLAPIGEKRKRRLWTRGRVIIIVLLLLFVGRIVQHWPVYRAEERSRQIAVVQYSHLKASCLDVTGDPFISEYVGAPRSPERLKALNARLLPLVSAKCLKVSDTDIAQNAYEAINPGTLDNAKVGTPSWDLLQGVLYYLDHGFSKFLPNGKTLCADGWVSSSRGPGTCSHHGGYDIARGSPLLFFSAKIIPNPQYQ